MSLLMAVEFITSDRPSERPATIIGHMRLEFDTENVLRLIDPA
jgi:hypothetical protein